MWGWSSQVGHPSPLTPHHQGDVDWLMMIAGTRIGQASECFVYWKDPSTSDTWGLNFTSPIDAKQFRECCDGSRSNSSTRMRIKAASSRSTPASPSRSREPQCTCSHPESLAGTKQRQSGGPEAGAHRMRGWWPRPGLLTHISYSDLKALKNSKVLKVISIVKGVKKQDTGFLIPTKVGPRNDCTLTLLLSLYINNLCKSNIFSFPFLDRP